jgi:hypothetical protein
MITHHHVSRMGVRPGSVREPGLTPGGSHTHDNCVPIYFPDCMA